MTEIIPAIMALIVEWFFCTTFFSKKLTTTTTQTWHLCLANKLFPLAMFNILLDLELIPVRYKQYIPLGSLRFFEFFECLICMELMRSIWHRMEQIIEYIVICILMNGDYELYENLGGDWLLGALVTAFSLYIWWNTVIITKQLDNVLNAIVKYKQGGNEKIQNFRCKIAKWKVNKLFDGRISECCELKLSK